jgi:membrane protease subunit HflC
MLRSLDALSSVVSANTSLILRTDAAPFNVLVQGPAGLGVSAAGPDTISASRSRHAS